MPSYEFECKKCHHYFTERRSVADRGIPCESPCPECGEVEVTRVMSGSPRIVSGVHVTDKRPDGWRDILKNIHSKSGKKSTIDY